MEAGWRSAPIVNASAWMRAWAVRRYGSASPILALASDTLFDAAYN